MNRTITLILIFIALGLLVYNVTLLNFDAIFKGDSLIAAIGIVASLCAIVLLLIFLTAKKIEEKVKKG